MEIEKLVLLRNILMSTDGGLFINYLSDYITSNACKDRNASEIKGMCELLEQIKKIPKEVENRRK